MKSGRFAHITQTFCACTSQIFRCVGFERVPANADAIGGHDLFYWALFIVGLSGWFLFIFVPQRERLTLLEELRDVLSNHLKEQTRELRRLQNGIAALKRNDPQAWERAARARMGWLEPGEVIDLSAYRPRNKPLAAIPPGPHRPNSGLSQNTVFPRPQVPTLPVVPVQLRTLRPRAIQRQM